MLQGISSCLALFYDHAKLVSNSGFPCDLSCLILYSCPPRFGIELYFGGSSGLMGSSLPNVAVVTYMSVRSLPPNITLEV